MLGSLALNNLGPQGGAALAEGLKGNTRLTAIECALLPNQERWQCGRPTSAAQPLTLVGQRTSSALFGSLENNMLTNNGEDMSGVHKLAEVLPQTKIEKLKCVALSPLAK